MLKNLIKLLFHQPRAPFAVMSVVAALAVAMASMVPSTPTLALATSARSASAAPGAPASCASLTTLSLPNTTIKSAVDTPAGVLPLPVPGRSPTKVFATCRVQAIVTTPGANDQIGIDVWMPVSGWNGRFEGVGGSAYNTGDTILQALAVDGGYSAATTDGGHSALTPLDGSFALDSSGRLNWALIQDFSYRAVHDLAVVGKAVTAVYYGPPATYSYEIE